LCGQRPGRLQAFTDNPESSHKLGMDDPQFFFGKPSLTQLR
jgi:hypothetical protein